MRKLLASLFIGGLLLTAPAAMAGDVVRVAVAANFTATAKTLVEVYEADCGCVVQVIAASTGKHYAQIANSAPYDLFLAADAEHPKKLVAAGLGVVGSQFTYALGQLALYGGLDEGLSAEDLLASDSYRHLALANPDLAPYGAAAVEYLKSLGLWDVLQDRMVFGENVAQAYQFVETGNAELGFVAYAQVKKDPARQVRLIPQEEYALLRQDAVLLVHGKNNSAARGFLKFLAGPAARAIIQDSGYGVMGDVLEGNGNSSGTSAADDVARGRESKRPD